MPTLRNASKQLVRPPHAHDDAVRQSIGQISAHLADSGGHKGSQGQERLRNSLDLRNEPCLRLDSWVQYLVRTCRALQAAL